MIAKVYIVKIDSLGLEYNNDGDPDGNNGDCSLVRAAMAGSLACVL